MHVGAPRLIGSSGWLVWPDWIAGRAVLALVVLVALWQMSSPWPLRRTGGDAQTP